MKQSQVNRLINRIECGSLHEGDTKVIYELKRTGTLSCVLNKCASSGFVNAMESIFHLIPSCLDLEDAAGRTPLHCAAKNGHLVTLNRLLDWGADGKRRTKSGNNLFHMIAKRKSSPTDLTLVKVDTSKSKHYQCRPQNVSIVDDDDDESDDDESDESDCEDDNSVNSVLESVYGIKEYLRRSFKSKYLNSQTVEMDEVKKKPKGKSKSDVSMNWCASLQEVGDFQRPFPDSCCKESNGYCCSKEERDFEEWKRELFEDGALERAEISNSADLLEYTLRRLLSFCDLNERNSAGKTPEEVAIEYENMHIADALRRLNGQKVQESRLQRITKTISKIVERSPSTDYIVMLREVLDSKPRVPLSKLPRVIPKDKKYRVLSMDGGGVRCIMHSIILGRILERYPTFLENTEMFAGCSGAALVSAGLVVGLTPDVIGRLTEITTAQTLTKPEGNGITGVRYTTRWLRLMGDLVLGNVQLRSLSRHVVIPSYSLDGGEKGEKRRGDVLFMTNAVDDPTNDVFLKDACLRSSSAPTYFRCYQSNIDGGLFANNPSGCALPIVVGSQPDGLGIPPENVVCLSLGTGFGYKACFEEPGVIEGGFLQWGTTLLDIINVSQSDYIGRCCRAVLGKRYFRSQPTLSNYIRLDNVKGVEYLKSLAEEYPLDSLFEWIEENWF